MAKSKQGVELEAGRVLKVHKSLEAAELEKLIAGLYSGNNFVPIRTPKYGIPFLKEQNVYLPMERIDGKDLMGNKDVSLARKLVLDLALFHEMFAQESAMLTSSAIYRDAINSNYMLDNAGIVHIDFSSSNKFVHCYDDLALLLHPLWSEIPDAERECLIREYIEHRTRFNALGVSSIHKIDSRLIANPSAEGRRLHYSGLLKEMEAAGFDMGVRASDFKGIDFNRLEPADFAFFFDFRTLRGEYYLQKVWGGRG
ncbi:MAG TPA: hypothetical protein HA362_04895 [Nanoarchaeota archaeon]|nr:hypothetical protein [Nanoarchaeota archaeon]